MKVFVIGTGRCGTTTFARACSHIKNFTSAHESTGGMRNRDRLRFADNHIEINPHLSWMLPVVAKLNGIDGAIWVHLQRKRAEVVASWVKRGPKIGPGLWIPLAMRVDAKKLTPEQYREACEICYDSMVGTIESFLVKAKFTMHIWLDEIEQRWPMFWRRIEARGNYDASFAELQQRHNAS